MKENSSLFPSLLGDRLETIEIKEIYDFSNLPKVDVIVSYIVLQHNTPPVQAYIIGCLLDSLTIDGVALLHIPIHHPFYQFSTIEYLNNENSGRNMEMHIVPKENLRDIAEAHNCKIVDSYGYGGTKGVYSEIFEFVKLH